jgi:hypothetical protein
VAADSPQDRLRRLRREADDDILLLLAAWADQSETWDVTRAHLADTLEAGHVDAHSLGRQLAGETAGVTEEDRTEGAAAWAADAPFWDKLDADVKRGRYGVPGSDVDPPKTDQLARRVGMYADKWTGTANEAWALSLPDGTELTWELGPNDETHCHDCPIYADGSPYTPDDLPAFPGDGSTDCLTLCTCRLVSSDGVEGFSRR